jgi:hypothetical protein
MLEIKEQEENQKGDALRKGKLKRKRRMQNFIILHPSMVFSFVNLLKPTTSQSSSKRPWNRDQNQ